MNTEAPEQVSTTILPYNTLPGSVTAVESQTRRGPSTWAVALIAVLLVLFLIGFTALAIWLAQSQAGTLAAVRDILIIILALESCLFGVVIILLLVMVMRLVNMLEFEIKPILQKTNETLGTVQGTTRFVSQNVVRPTIRARARMAGARQALKTLFGDPGNNIK